MLAGQNIDKFGNSPSFSKNEYAIIHIKVSPSQKFCYIIQHEYKHIHILNNIAFILYRYQTRKNHQRQFNAQPRYNT